jgi:class 3 adenylate cyclase
MQVLARRIVAQHAWEHPSEAAADFEPWTHEWNDSVAEYQKVEGFSLAAFFLSHLGDDDFWSGVWEIAKGWKNRCAPLSGLAIDAARGLLAMRLGLIDEAEEAFRDGVEWAEREGCPVELGRNLHGLGLVAERRGDTALALEYLDRAAAQFQPRGVKLFLDQVIEAKLRLQGLTDIEPTTSIVAVNRALQDERPNVAADADAAGAVTIMFSDIEGSTALNDRLGDAAWLEVLHAHNAIVDGAVQAHSGRTVKTMGDGYMVTFASPEAAVRCALAVQAGIAAEDWGGTPIRVRIGLHTGLVVRDAGDFFGREVNFAARVAGAALGGEVLVSASLHERLDPGEGWGFGERREVELKGFKGRHRLWRVALETRRPGGLSARESEVLSLLAAGRTNREIAEELVLSPATVSRHVANLYEKLGVHRKAEAVAAAMALGLGPSRPAPT